MSHISPELIFGILIAGIVVLSFVGKLMPKRRPKEKNFKCSRCGASSPHTERTIEAWRMKNAKFFCQTCHAKWLQSRPHQEREQSSSRRTVGSQSGCLGIVVLFAFIPILAYLLARAYA
jgi:hypothetical protein